ncbi:MAG: hypothetical protein SPI53_03925 [Erysipelotrichaceae bacterium]|nr:hypothetical protein [Erysipelotrichaceae bacterium]
MGRFEKWEIILMALIFITSITMVIIGQRNVGYPGLLMEIIGVMGLVVDLYLYNRKFR